MRSSPLTSTIDAKQPGSTETILQTVSERVDVPINNASMTRTRRRGRATHFGAEKPQDITAITQSAGMEELPKNWQANNDRYFPAYPKLMAPETTNPNIMRSQLTRPSTPTLLSLPLELRRLIYTFLLEAKGRYTSLFEKKDSDHHSASQMLIGNPSYKRVSTSDIWAPFYRRDLFMFYDEPLTNELCHRHETYSFGCWLHPHAHSLLLTNRQMHQDFLLFLYDTYTFHLLDPKSANIWLWNIGANIGKIGKIHIRISSGQWDRELWSAWCDVFQLLAGQASALRFIRVSFDESSEPGDLYSSAGEDWTMNWAVGEMRSLRTIELAGGYSDIWPEYLRQATAARVLEVGDEECESCYPQEARSWFMRNFFGPLF